MAVRMTAPPVAVTRPGRGWADLSAVLAALSVLVVFGLWVRGGGKVGLTLDAASAASSVGRLAGLLAADLLLLQVLLMARVPWVERGYGQDRLARWHRYVGFGSFWFMVAHVVFIVVGYAGTGHVGLVRESIDLTVNYPAMLMAVAGTGLVIGVTVLSIRAARRRLRYESWHLLHLYAYIGVGLAIPHQLWTGTDFIDSGLARAYWWTLWALAAAAIVVYRIALPLWRSTRHRFRVKQVRWESPDVFSVYLAGKDLHRLPVRAGQFANWRFLTGTGWMRAHPYSVSALPRRDQLRITVRAGGDDAARIAAARPGTRVLMEGPYGRLTAAVRTRQRLLFLAAGIGITPLRALLEELPYRPGEADLVYRANTDDGFALHAELDRIASRRGARIHYLAGPPPARSSWLPASLAHVSDVDMLRRIVPDVAYRDVYLCGPAPWMDAVRVALWQARVPQSQVHAEDFAW